MPRPQQPVNAAPATFSLQNAAKEALSHCQHLPPLSRLIGGLPFRRLAVPVKVPASALPTPALLTPAPALSIPQLEAIKEQFPTQFTRIPPPLPPPTSASAPPLGQLPRDELARQGVCNLPAASAVLRTYPGPTERKLIAMDKKPYVEAHGCTADSIAKGEGDTMAVSQRRWKDYLDQD
jgi:hypothetical protein